MLNEIGMYDAKKVYVADWSAASSPARRKADGFPGAAPPNTCDIPLKKREQ
jgi:hypothetical protein